MDIASYSTLAAERDADGGTHAPADEPGTAYPHTRRLSMSAASEDPDGALEASFLAYFERMLDDMVERHVSRRDREQPAAPPEAKSPRNSRNSQVSVSVRVIELGLRLGLGLGMGLGVALTFCTSTM